MVKEHSLQLIPHNKYYETIQLDIDGDTSISQLLHDTYDVDFKSNWYEDVKQTVDFNGQAEIPLNLTTRTGTLRVAQLIYDYQNMIQEKFVSGDDLTEFKSRGAVMIESSSQYSGAHIKGLSLFGDDTYILSYKYRKVSGTLNSFGGHIDNVFKGKVSLKVDGVERAKQYDDFDSVFVADDTKVHSVEYVFKTEFGSSFTDKLYIQPNRGDATPVKVEVFDLILYRKPDEESVWLPAMWYPNPADMKSHIEEAQSQLIQATKRDGQSTLSRNIDSGTDLPVKYHDEPYSIKVFKPNYFETEPKNFSINEIQPKKIVAFSLYKKSFDWEKQTQTESIDYDRQTINDVNRRPADSYIKTQGTKGTKTTNWLVEKIDGIATGNETYPYTVITKHPTEEIYIQGTGKVEWRREVYKTTNIQYSVIKQNNSNVFIGDDYISQQGVTGTRSYYRENEYLNGAKTGEYRNVDTAGTITTKAKPEIWQIGTKPREVTIETKLYAIAISSFKYIQVDKDEYTNQIGSKSILKVEIGNGVATGIITMQDDGASYKITFENNNSNYFGFANITFGTPVKITYVN